MTQPIILEYGMPNMCKPFNYYHLRSFIVGDAFRRVMTAAGEHVISDLHSSDVGEHVGCLIYYNKYINAQAVFKTIQDIYQAYFLVKNLSQDNQAVENGILEESIALQKDPLYFAELRETLYNIYKQYVKDFMQDLGVATDRFGRESEYLPCFEPLAAALKERNVLKVDGLEMIMGVTHIPSLPPLMIRHKDGRYLYAGINFAATFQRNHLFKPKKICYIITETLDLHMRQMFDAAEQLSLSSEMVHVKLGGLLINHSTPIRDPFSLLKALRECPCDVSFKSEDEKRIFIYNAFKLENYIREPNKKVFVAPLKFQDTKGYKLLKDYKRYHMTYESEIQEGYSSRAVTEALEVCKDTYSLVPLMNLLREKIKNLYYKVDEVTSINIANQIMSIFDMKI